MKILAVNYHYFLYGGPDRYFFNVKEALEAEGHTVVPFAFDYVETLDTPYRVYFPEPITGRGPCLLSMLSLSTTAKIRAVFRMFRNTEVRRRFRALLEAEQPDAILSIFLADSMLPDILHIAKKEYGIPVIYRVSDYHMYCASHLFFRDDAVCTACKERPWSAVKYACVHGSRLASALRVLQMKYFRYRRWYDSVDIFLCPSKLMADHLIQSGIAHYKVVHLPTFAKDLSRQPRGSDAEPPYILYFGWIKQQKGAEVLVEAFNRVRNPGFRLRMVGYVETGFRNSLLDKLDDDHKGVTDILPPQHGEELVRTIRHALCVVHPSICLDNMPNSVLEAMSAGKAVLASNLGSLPELVHSEVNGRLCEPGDVDALSDAMETLVSLPDLLERMGAASRSLYEQNYTEAIHMQRLRDILLRCVHKQS